MLKPLTKAKSTLKDTIFDSLMHGVMEQYVMLNLMTAKPLVSRSQPHSLQGEPHHTNTYQPHHQRQTKANYVALGSFHIKSASFEPTNTYMKKACVTCPTQGQLATSGHFISKALQLKLQTQKGRRLVHPVLLNGSCDIHADSLHINMKKKVPSRLQCVLCRW